MTDPQQSGSREPAWTPPVWPAPQPGPPQGIPLTPAMITALPVDERSYPAFYRTPRFRWWKPLPALLMGGLLAFVAMLVPPLIGMLLDHADFAEMARTGKLVLGPWGFLGNNVGIALLIPIAMLTQWAIFGQRPRWLSSVAGGFRWRWFAQCVAVVVPVWLVINGVELAVGGLPADIRVRPYTVLLTVGILLTTPFQAAGEEYLMRGLEQRLVSSWFPWDKVGFVAATLVSSLTFMALHGAGDPWLNLFYFTFGAAACWIGWRTGGLEASIAIHVVNNLLAEAFMPVTDFSDMFNREAGTGDASVLLPMAVLILTVAFLTWWAPRRGVVRSSAPGRAELESAAARAASAFGYVPGGTRP